MASVKYCDLTDKEKVLVQMNNAYKAFLKEFDNCTLKFRFEVVDKEYSKMDTPYIEYTESKLRGDFEIAYNVLMKVAFKKYLESHPLHQASYKIHSDGHIEVEVDSKNQQIMKDFFAPKDSKMIDVEKEMSYYLKTYGLEYTLYVPSTIDYKLKKKPTQKITV